MAKDRKKIEGRRHIIRRLYIACEGKETEYNYFKNYIDECDVSSKYFEMRALETDKNTAKELIGFLREMRKSLKDELWAVFDKNGYTNHPDAFKMAKDNNIKIAFSSISFEFWILLHFEYTTRAFERAEEVIGYIKKKGYIDYKKSDRTTYRKIKSNTAAAGTHARRVRKYQDEANPDSKIYELNPYTNVDELLETIEKMSEAVNGI